MNNKTEDIADTVTVEIELTEEVTFAINDVFNSFDELGKKTKKYEAKGQFDYGGGIREQLRQPVNNFADIWISKLKTMSSLMNAFMVDGNFGQKEKEREPLIKLFY